MPDNDDRSDDQPLEDDDPVERVRDHVETVVRCGFDSRDEILEDVIEELTEELEVPEGDADTVALAAMLVDRAWRRLVDEQAGWPEVTDCDRLDAAFAELERRRIIARQNFTCCQTCGLSEIWGEADGWPHEPRGYVFFHVQATERAAAGGGLDFSYGSTDQQDATVTAIANEVVEVLREHDLDATWNGDRNRKIAVALDWRRRVEPLPSDGRAPAGEPV